MNVRIWQTTIEASQRPAASGQLAAVNSSQQQTCLLPAVVPLPAMATATATATQTAKTTRATTGTAVTAGILVPVVGHVGAPYCAALFMHFHGQHM